MNKKGQLRREWLLTSKGRKEWEISFQHYYMIFLKEIHYTNRCICIDKKVKGILSSSNGMNLYRGCLHGCIYCDSRSDCYHMDHLFEDIEVKENALELLDASLKKKRKPCMIGMGL